MPVDTMIQHPVADFSAHGYEWMRRPKCGFRIFLIIKWRCLVISTKELQINEQIRANEVRLIGADGEQVGIVKLAAAQDMA